MKNKVCFGNMKLSIEVVGGEGHGELINGSLEAKINFMADDPEFTYPDVTFIPKDNEPLTATQVQYLYELMKSLDETRRHIGIKTGHYTLRIKEPEDWLRD